MKHAFLIMAHSNYDLLGRIIHKLDHPQHHFFIHIDKKSTLSGEELDTLKNVAQSAPVTFIERMIVTWGGYSQIQCELNLLAESIKSDCDYFHLISGNDYPIKPVSEIHRFFKQHAGKEFVHYAGETFNQQSKFRFEVYHPFQDKIGRNHKTPLYHLEKLLIRGQRVLPFLGNRSKNHTDIIFHGGSNWFSITRKLAAYVLKKETLIQDLFHHTLCCDEFFLQTIVANSPFYQQVYLSPETGNYEQCLRYVDWERGNPYTFESRDYDELVQSNFLFCRKVNNETPEQIELLNRLDTL